MDNAYFIQCGNWCLRMHADTIAFDTPTEWYLELATRAIEIVFGDAEFTDDRDDYLKDREKQREKNWPTVICGRIISR